MSTRPKQSSPLIKTRDSRRHRESSNKPSRDLLIVVRGVLGGGGIHNNRYFHLESYQESNKGLITSLMKPISIMTLFCCVRGGCLLTEVTSATYFSQINEPTRQSVSSWEKSLTTWAVCLLMKPFESFNFTTEYKRTSNEWFIHKNPRFKLAPFFFRSRFPTHTDSRHTLMKPTVQSTVFFIERGKVEASNIVGVTLTEYKRQLIILFLVFLVRPFYFFLGCHFVACLSFDRWKRVSLICKAFLLIRASFFFCCFFRRLISWLRTETK